MLNIGICDDDMNILGKLEDMLDLIKEQEHIKFETEVYLDGQELLNDIYKNGKKYDLIFLDIEMKVMDGLTTAKEIRKVDDFTMLIYVTSHESYAIEAYEVQPFQFLVKPVKYETFHKYFMKAYEKITDGPYYFYCQFGGSVYNLRINEIIYFKSNRRIIQVYMQSGEVIKFYGKMGDIEDCMKREKTDFWRIHQSYLVNIKYIANITYDQIILKNEKALSISEDRRRLIGEKYSHYIKESIIE